MMHIWAKNHENMFILTDERIQLAVIEILRDHKKLIDTRKIDRVQTLLSLHWLKLKVAG